MTKIIRLSLLLFFQVLMFAGNVQAQAQTDADLANQYASTGEFDKAVVYYEKWYSRDPLVAYQPYVKCLISLKDYEKAEKVIRKQIKKVPSNAVLWVDLGNLFSIQGKESDAKSNFEKAIKSLYPDVQQIISLGNAFVELRQYEYAEATYLQGKKQLNGTYPFSFELADVYAQKQEPQKMVEEYLDILEYNESYLPNVQAILQNKMAFDLEGGLTDVIRQSLLRKIQKGSGKPIYTELLYWLLLQEKDYASAFIQAKALDKRYDETGGRLISLGQLCVSNNEYETAIQCFNYVIDKGKNNSNYVNARMELLKAYDQKITTSGTITQVELKKLEQDYTTTLDELGRNQVTAPIISKFAHLKAFYLDKVDEAITLLTETIELPGISPLFVAECKLELGDILVLNGEVWDASLYYSQVDKDFKHDAIGREAKYRNARLSYYMGEFEWAAAQLNVLKAATSQLISNDAMSLALLIMDNTITDSSTIPLLIYSRADLQQFRNHFDIALTTLDSITTMFPGHSLTDEVYYKEADIWFRKGDFVKAASLYKEVFEKYPDDILGDDALYHLASITENQLKDPATAKSLYEMFLTKYPGSLFAVDARKRFRLLRGDTAN